MLFIGRQPLGIPNDQLHYHWNDMLPGNTQRRRLIINVPLSLHPRSPRGPMRAKSSRSFKNQLFLTRPFLLRQNRQVKKRGIVGTPPPENTCHTPHGDTKHALPSESPPSGYTWRASHIRTTSRKGKRHPHPDTRDAPLISGLPQGSANDTYKHKTSGRLPQIHPDDQHKPFGYNCPDHWLK